MVLGKQQKNKQQLLNKSETDDNNTTTSSCEPHGIGTSQLPVEICTDEPQTPFTLLQLPSDNNELFHSTVVAADDLAEQRIQQQQPQQVVNCYTNIDERSLIRNELNLPERTKWGPSLSLPDIDDVSMTYTSLYMENYKVDLLWSMTSDSFFILGGIVYIVLSAWDYYNYKNEISKNDNSNHWYSVVDLMAPTVYFLNSVIDVHWAAAVRRRLLNKQDMTKTWDEARLQLRRQSVATSDNDQISEKVVDQIREKVDDQQCFGCTWCHRMRKYAAHRRTMLAAFTFGVAASLSVIAAVLRNAILPHYQTEFSNVHMIGTWAYTVDSIIDTLSDNLYILSAIFSMTGKRHRPWLVAQANPTSSLSNDSDRLEDLGDLLFLIGSLVDATLSVFHLKHLLLLPIFSSILWMIDGCLYMRSDIVKARKLHDEAVASQSDEHPIKFVV